MIYIWRVTKPFERQCESTDLEMSCMAWAFSKCHHLLEGSDVMIYTDHEAIKGVLSSAPGTQYSMRIDNPRMALMPFLDRITVIYMPREQMKMVDPLSRARYQDQATEKPASGAMGEPSTERFEQGDEKVDDRSTAQRHKKPNHNCNSHPTTMDSLRSLKHRALQAAKNLTPKCSTPGLPPVPSIGYLT